MVGIVKWSRKNDDDWEAEVRKCVRIDDQINITFGNLAESIEGRVSFAAKNGKQNAIGKWINNPKTSTSEGFSVTIQGKLTKFVGQVIFEGTWNEKDGEPWSFHVDTAFT